MHHHQTRTKTTKGETYRTRFRLNSISSTGRGMYFVRSACSVSWLQEAGYDVLMSTIVALIYLQKGNEKERKENEGNPE
jgi:hypothetical protein